MLRTQVCASSSYNRNEALCLAQFFVFTGKVCLSCLLLLAVAERVCSTTAFYIKFFLKQQCLRKTTNKIWFYYVLAFPHKKTFKRYLGGNNVE